MSHENNTNDTGSQQQQNAAPHAEPRGARNENSPDLSERILDKEENEQDNSTLQQKAQAQTDKLKTETEENTRRSDNQERSDRILDKEIDDEDTGSAK